MKQFLYILGLWLCIAQASAQPCPILPKPQSAEAVPGEFVLSESTGLYLDASSLQDVSEYLQRELLRFASIPLTLREGTPTGSYIQLRLDKQQAKESYQLDMRPGTIQITGGDAAGVFNGVVSLLQLIRQSKQASREIALSCWNIQDAPAFLWRGVMLDASRHFIPKERVRMVLDWMAFYKLNRLHWHLSDAPGWRIEIKQYPKLATVGGQGDHLESDLPAAYYTQEDIAEIVDYAAKRNITVIPEIDMPGHATAANRAYPEFSGGGSEAHPEFTFDPGNPGTYGYLSDILKEVDALFPAKMLHLGGDEVSFGSAAWKQNTGIQELMKTHNLSDLKAVERYFMERMADSVFSMGSRIAVWDEMADAQLPRDKVIMYWWRQDKPEQFYTALENGYQVVVCPRLPLYFDFVQDSTHQYGRKWSGKYNSLDQVYNYDIGVFEQKASPGQILGFQANLWTERIHSPEKLEYMLFPRIAALAELAWTPRAKRDYTRFKVLLKTHIEYYEAEGIYYYDPYDHKHPEPDYAEIHKKHKESKP